MASEVSLLALGIIIGVTMLFGFALIEEKSRQWRWKRTNARANKVRPDIWVDVVETPSMIRVNLDHSHGSPPRFVAEALDKNGDVIRDTEPTMLGDTPYYYKILGWAPHPMDAVKELILELQELKGRAPNDR